MKTGTKSILFGAHAFWLHWFFVAKAWTKLYGFTFDPRMYVVFLIHDIGYLGKEKMDDEKGEQHPIVGANLMSWMFDDQVFAASWFSKIIGKPLRWIFGHAPCWANFKMRITNTDGSLTTFPVPHICNVVDCPTWKAGCGTWYNFCKYHSRFLAKKDSMQYSRLCIADKLAFCLTPRWLYLIMVNWSDEIKEYMHPGTSYGTEFRDNSSQQTWHESVRTFVAKWVEEHKDGVFDETTVARNG